LVQLLTNRSFSHVFWIYLFEFILGESLPRKAGVGKVVLNKEVSPCSWTINIRAKCRAKNMISVNVTF
jgi:hypothetical protein